MSQAAASRTFHVGVCFCVYKCPFFRFRFLCLLVLVVFFFGSSSSNSSGITVCDFTNITSLGARSFACFCVCDRSRIVCLYIWVDSREMFHRSTDKVDEIFQQVKYFTSIPKCQTDATVNVCG